MRKTKPINEKSQSKALWKGDQIDEKSKSKASETKRDYIGFVERRLY